MVLRYVFCFVSLLVYFIMLMDVLPTGRVAASVECFVLLMFHNKSNIIPVKPKVRIYTYVHESLLTCKYCTSVHVSFPWCVLVKRYFDCITED